MKVWGRAGIKLMTPESDYLSNSYEFDPSQLYV